MTNVKLVYGVGINDADYKVTIKECVAYDEKGNKKFKTLWICPFYRCWSSMLGRCYSENYQKSKPTYIGSTVFPEWHRFTTFRAWMEKQEWEGNVLDKDLLIKGNKVYSPTTCLFIPKFLNSFLIERQNDRGEWPIGVSFDKQRNKFRASCSSAIKGERNYIGLFDSAQEAHLAWKCTKLRYAIEIAKDIKNDLISSALIKRYSEYE